MFHGRNNIDTRKLAKADHDHQRHLDSVHERLVSLGARCDGTIKANAYGDYMQKLQHAHDAVVAAGAMCKSVGTAREESTNDMDSFEEDGREMHRVAKRHGRFSGEPETTDDFAAAVLKRIHSNPQGITNYDPAENNRLVNKALDGSIKPEDVLRDCLSRPNFTRHSAK